MTTKSGNIDKCSMKNLTSVTFEPRTLTMPQHGTNAQQVAPNKLRNTRHKNPQLVVQHCFVATFGRYFPIITLRDQLVAQQKHLLRVEESCCEK